jgi:glycosyltransferase involved in cell wall biosynthesis
MNQVSAPSGKPRLTIAILTLNESKRISKCIRSALFADEIVVVDSASTDDTVAIAKSLGAQVHVYPDWQGFSVQRDRLLKHATGDYIFFLDADEEFTPELVAELQAVMASGDQSVWELRWIQVAFGKPLTWMRSTGSVQRLFWRTDIERFEGVVHEHAVLREKRDLRRFKHRLLHHSRETIHGSLLKLAQYAQLGAVKRAKLGKTGGIFRGLLSAGSNFFRLYFLQRGFMCGPQGFLYCLFVCMESFFRYVALKYDREHLKNLVKR